MVQVEWAVLVPFEVKWFILDKEMHHLNKEGTRVLKHGSLLNLLVKFS